MNTVRHKVSVVIPAWGETPFLSRAVRSVQSQTYENLELIVVEPPANGPRTALAARLEGVRRASGEWILFVDADDWIAPCMVERMLAEVDEDQDVDVVVSGLIRGKERILFPSGSIWDAGPSDIFNSLVAKLFHRSLFPELSLDLSVTYGEDLMTTAQLFYRARKIANLRQAFYHYCSNPMSITHTFDGRRRVMDLVRVGSVLRASLPDSRLVEFHDRIARDALLLWCRYRLFDKGIWRQIRETMRTPLLSDRRHGLVKKGALFCAHFLFD